MVIASGWPTVAVNGPAIAPAGPRASGPPDDNFTTGGVFPFPASPASASISQSGCRLPGMANVSPRIRIVQVTFLSPKFAGTFTANRSEEHTSELQSQSNLVCRLLLEKKKKYK